MPLASGPWQVAQVVLKVAAPRSTERARFRESVAAIRAVSLIATQPTRISIATNIVMPTRMRVSIRSKIIRCNIGFNP